MNHFIESEPFSKESYEMLRSYSHKASYIKTLKENELEILEGFSLCWFYDSAQVIGYALIDNVLGSFFYAHDDHEDILKVVSETNTYTYLAYFEIFKDKQGIQEHYMIVYTTEDSAGFWESKGYMDADYSEWWLMHAPVTDVHLTI